MAIKNAKFTLFFCRCLRQNFFLLMYSQIAVKLGSEKTLIKKIP